MLKKTFFVLLLAVVVLTSYAKPLLIPEAHTTSYLSPLHFPPVKQFSMDKYWNPVTTTNNLVGMAYLLDIK